MLVRGKHGERKRSEKKKLFDFREGVEIEHMREIWSQKVVLYFFCGFGIEWSKSHTFWIGLVKFLEYFSGSNVLNQE